VSIETWTVIGVVAAVVAVPVAVLAFVWQVRAHHRSGPLVSVESDNVLPTYGPLNEPGDDWYVRISVINRGGAPVTVTNYGVRMGRKDRNMFVTNRPRWATALPATLEPGGVPAGLLVLAEDLRRTHHELGIPYSEMTPWVALGDGRRVYSKNPIPLA
jgi:hypothetical protein